MVASLILSTFGRHQLPVPVVTSNAGETIVWLTGEQDLAVVDALQAALADAIATAATSDDPRHAVVVDLRGVTFIDSSTAQALIDATFSPPGSILSLTLRAPSACVRRMFALCGRADLLDTA